MARKIYVTILFLLNFLLEVVHVFTEPSNSPRVCIIGAGYSGLATARYIKEHGLNLTIFEATRYIGGNWRFDPNVGIDEDGLPIFSSQYKKLRTNSPYQTLEFAGFPFPEGTVSYPTGDCYYKYLKAFTKHFSLLDNIQFRSLITSVQWAGDRWNLTYMKTDTKENVTEECDFVVVANGEYGTPNVPYFEGQETFEGKIMHSHDYKDPEHYRGLRVLIIGGGPSGIDISVQLSKISSKLIHSHHLPSNFYNEPDFGDHYIRKPDLNHFTSTGALFKDGSTEDFDIAILCTGYNYSHPFLNHKSSGITATEKYVIPLYQHIVNINHPSMTFVGLPKTVATRLQDAQAEYVAALATGRFKLPTQEDMFRHWLDYLERIKKEKNMTLSDINFMGLEQMDDYFAVLHEESGITRMPPVITTMCIFDAHSYMEDFVNFRNYDYQILDNTKFRRIYNPKTGPCLIDV